METNAITAILASASSDQDALAATFNWWIQMADGMSQSTFWFFIRVGIILILQTVACSVIFTHGREHMQQGALATLQWITCAVIYTAVAQVHFNELPASPAAKGFCIAVATLAIVILPPRLSWFLAWQQNFRVYTCVGIWGIAFFLTLIQILH